jgi:hypothetical protein
MNSAATRSPINLINNGWTSPEEGDWVDKHLSCMKLAISVDDQVLWTLIASSKREKMIGNNEPITDWKGDQHCKHCDGRRPIMLQMMTQQQAMKSHCTMHHITSDKEESHHKDGIKK